MTLHQVGRNQTEVHLANGTYLFFSYDTLVAACIPGTGFLRTATQYSRTTSKHINQWLHGAQAEVVAQEALEALAR